MKLINDLRARLKKFENTLNPKYFLDALHLFEKCENDDEEKQLVSIIAPFERKAIECLNKICNSPNDFDAEYVWEWLYALKEISDYDQLSEAKAFEKIRLPVAKTVVGQTLDDDIAEKLTKYLK